MMKYIGGLFGHLRWLILMAKPKDIDAACAQTHYVEIGKRGPLPLSKIKWKNRDISRVEENMRTKAKENLKRRPTHQSKRTWGKIKVSSILCMITRTVTQMRDVGNTIRN